MSPEVPVLLPERLERFDAPYTFGARRIAVLRGALQRTNEEEDNILYY